MSDYNFESEEVKLVAEIFLTQPDAYFQTLLVDTFESFMRTRGRSQAEDCFLLRMVYSFTHAFTIFTHGDIKLISLCEEQTYRFLLAFFKDKDLVEKCSIDLSPNTNSQETDSDTDTEIADCQSAS